MNKVPKLLLVSLFISQISYAQFGYRELLKDQDSESFFPLKYITMKDSVYTGYGFPNPTASNAIVVLDNIPEGEKTRGWTSKKVKYAEFYRFDDILKNKLIKKYTDSIKIDFKKRKDIDTVKIYHLKNMRGGVANGLNKFVLENKNLRFFEAIKWEGYYAAHRLVFVQFTDAPIFESKTYFLNYNNKKAFERSAERLFKKCNAIIDKVYQGNYYPKLYQNLKKLANDYSNLCTKK